MKRIVIILIGLISVAYGQYSPTSAKSRFVNGLALGTKLDSYFNAADSNAIYWRADSALMAKYKGTARALAFSGDLTPYKLISDTFFTNGYTTRARLKQYGDSLGAVKLNISDSSIYFNNVVRTFGTQTVGGNKTFSNDIVVNSTTFGLGSGTQSILIGNSSSSSGTRTIAIGAEANSAGTRNIAIGSGSSGGNSSAADNVSLGSGAGAGLTSGSGNTILGKDAGRFYGISSPLQTPQNSVFIGTQSKGLTNTDDNTIVIGASAIGNGSNTVTIGNSSVTDNYFTGNVRGAKGIFTAPAFGIPLSLDVPSGFNANIDFKENGATKWLARSKADDSFEIYDSTASASRLFINSSGAIGVGTTSPSVIGVEAVSASTSVYFSANGGAVTTYYGSNSALGVGLFGTITNHDLDIYSNSSQRGKVTAAGDFYMNNVYTATVGGTNRDVFVDNTGLLGYVSSFRASKKNIVPISNTYWLHKLNPVTFNYRIKDSTGNYTDSAYKELEYGLVAEEVESVNKEMVFYDVDSTGNKKLRGVHYSKLIIPLLAEVKEHKKRIDAQDKIIEALLTRIKSLEAKLN